MASPPFRLIVLVFLPIALATIFCAAARAEVQFLTDFDAARRASEATGMPLLVHFYTDHCPPCRMLETRAFRDESLAQAIRSNAIAVKVDAETQRTLADQYRITRWPTDLYLSPSGDELHRMVSPQDPSVYLQVVERVALRNRDWVIAHNAKIASRERRLAAMQERGTTPQAPAKPEVRGPFADRVAPGQVGPAPVSTQLGQLKQPEPTASRPHGDPIDNPFGNLAAPSSTAAHSSPFRTVSANPAWRAPQDSPTTEFASVNGTQGASASHTPSTEPSLPPVVSVQRPAALTASPAASVQEETRIKEALQERIVAQLQTMRDSIAMEGYCPVTLTEYLANPTGQGWRLGDQQYSVRHRGRIYRMASEEQRQKFLAAPDHFSPVLSGFDLVAFLESGRLVEGRREFGRAVEGKVFLFADRYTQEKFDRMCARYLGSLKEMFDSESQDLVAEKVAPNVQR